jgi:hypothetical protein
VVQAVEHLPSKGEALSSNPSIAKRKKMDKNKTLLWKISNDMQSKEK